MGVGREKMGKPTLTSWSDGWLLEGSQQNVQAPEGSHPETQQTESPRRALSTGGPLGRSPAAFIPLVLLICVWMRLHLGLTLALGGPQWIQES